MQMGRVKTVETEKAFTLFNRGSCCVSQSIIARQDHWSKADRYCHFTRESRNGKIFRKLPDLYKYTLSNTF